MIHGRVLLKKSCNIVKLIHAINCIQRLFSIQLGAENPSIERVDGTVIERKSIKASRVL